MIKIQKDILKGLRLTESEASVYLAALELGEANMKQIALKSGVKRTSIYNFIDEPKGRGLILEIKKKKRKYYIAVNPRRLLFLVEGQIKEVKQTLPDLLAIYNKAENKPRVQFFEGVTGIKEVYADTLEEGKPIIAWSDFENIFRVLGRFADEYPKERARREIPFRSIVVDSKTAREVVKRNTRELREMKFLSSGSVTTEINIYGNKVAMIGLKSESPFAVLIEDQGFADTLRLAWTELWKRLPSTHT